MFGRPATCVPAPAFEVLEDRRHMSASVTGTTVLPTAWRIVVRYASDTPGVGVNASTIGNSDIRVDSPARTLPVALPAFSVTGRLWMEVLPQQDGSVLAVYEVPAREGAWDYADTAAYTIALNAGEVRDANGNQVGSGALRTYNLWFNTPRAAVTSRSVVGSHWQFVVEYSDNGPLNGTTIASAPLEVRGPGVVADAEVLYTIPDSASLVRVYYWARITQGAVSWLNRGSYSVVLLPNGVRDMAGNAVTSYVADTAPLVSTKPRVEVVSESRDDARWQVTVRFLDDVLMTPTGVSAGALNLRNGEARHDMTLTAPLQWNAIDGSLVGTYTIDRPGTGWDGWEVNSYGPAIRDSQGNEATGGHLISVEEAATTRPRATVVSSGLTAPNRWDVTLRLEGPSGVLIDRFARGGLQLRWVGVRFSPIIDSVEQVGGAYIVRAHVTRSINFLPGRYYVRLGVDTLQGLDGSRAPDVELARFDL
jgi:hypothetical protein